MIKNAIVVSSKSAFFNLQMDTSNSDIYADNHPLFAELNETKNNVLYLYEKDIYQNKKIDIRNLWSFFHSWYRSDNGSDKTVINGISIGQCLNRRAFFSFTADIKNFYALKKLSCNYQTIYVDDKCSQSIKRLSKIFNITWYKSMGNVSFESTPERGNYYDHPSIHPLSNIARIIQFPFRFFLKRKKILYFRDWTSISLAKKRTDTLVENSLNFFKGFYFKYNKKAFERYSNVFPEEFDYFSISFESLKALSIKTDNNFDDDLIKHFIRTIETDYQTNRKRYMRTLSIYDELFSYYKPRKIILSGENEFHNIICYNLARARGIVSYLLIDGYQSMENGFNLFRDENNKKFVFEKYIAQGLADRDLMISLGMSETDIVSISPPIIELYKEQRNKNLELDKSIMIMEYLPNFTNPLSSFDAGFEIEVEIIVNLIKLGYDDFCIKVKKGRWPTNKTEEKYYKRIKFFTEAVVKVRIVDEFLYDHINSALFCIGQISTANIEAIWNDVPYYIYEPYENGHDDLFFNSSKIYSSESVSKNIEELTTNIQNKYQSINVSKEYIFDGRSFAYIDL